MKKLLLIFALLCAPAAFAQSGSLGSISSPVVNSLGQPIAGANVAICQPLVTTAATVTSNLAVLTTASNPITAGFASGMTIEVAGFGGSDTYFNGGAFTNGAGITNGFTILAVTSTTITYALTHANAMASTNGTVLQQGNFTTSCAGLASITSDPAGANSIAQPLTTDGLGNWAAYASPGVYYVQFYGSGITTRFQQVAIACVPSASTAACGASLNGNNAWTGNETHSGTETFSGPTTFSGATIPVTIGNATQPTPPFSNGIVAPLDLFSDRDTNITTANTYENAQLYIGRTSTTSFGATQCPGGGQGAWLSACDEPLAVIVGTNTNSGTTTTSALVGLEIGLFGAASDAASPNVGANFWAGLGINVQDKPATPNTVNLRGANIIVDVLSLPNQLAASGLSRSAAGAEIDINNSSGSDAFSACQSSAGNCTFGISFISFGANNQSAAMSVSSSSSSGKGWRYALEAGGISDAGIDIFPSNSLTPTYGAKLSADGTTGTGLEIGCGTVADPLGCTNPGSVAIFLDAKGTSGTVETQNSGILTFRTKTASSSGTDWQVQGIGSSKDLDFTHIGDATVLELSPTGIANRVGLQSFNSSTTCTTSASAGAVCTTASISLPVAYSDTNYRVDVTGLSPTNVPVIQTVAKSNSSFTVTIAALTAAAASFGSFDFIVTHN